MKKIITVLLAALMLLSAVCALAEDSPVGGWNVAETTDLTDESKALFAKALDGLVGVSYEPVAYLGSQVVAGLNHCYLCKATVVYPDAVPSLVLIYIYEDLDGKTEITNIVDLDIGVLSNSAEPAEE